MAEAQRLFSKADVRALRPSTSIADPGVVALQDELDRVGQQILLHAMRSRTQRLKEKPPHGRVDRQLTEADISAGVHALELRWLDELTQAVPAGAAADADAVDAFHPELLEVRPPTEERPAWSPFLLADASSAPSAASAASAASARCAGWNPALLERGPRA